MTNRNILFVVGSINPQKGGVARVVDNISAELCKCGYSIFCIAAVQDFNGPFSCCWTFKKPYCECEENRSQLIELYDKYRFDYVIVENPQSPWYVDAVSPLKGKTHLIGHFHNSPLGYYSTNKFIQGKGIADSYMVRKVAFYFNCFRNRKFFSKVRAVFDKMVLLSESYKREMVELSGFPEEKLIGIPNPFPLLKNDVDYQKKENTILYVGRISNAQKRIGSLLNIWKLVQAELPNWNIEIVGGGPELCYWKRQSSKMNLKRISFRDFVDPEEYYIKSKIILMTSLYEGFPMVLVEAMQYGCIPIAYNSFAALSDIIEDSINGYMIKPFDSKEYVRKLIMLANDEDRMMCMSKRCMEKSSTFDSKVVAKKWINLFSELNFKAK